MTNEKQEKIAKPSEKVIEIDKEFKEKTILSLALDCSASIEGIQRFFASIYGIHVSVGYVSSVLKKTQNQPKNSMTR